MSDTKKEPKKATKKTSDKKLDSKLTWLPKKTFELEITIPKTKIEANYKTSLDKLIKDTTVKGFRKGKAPAKMVEAQVGRTKILEEAAQHLVSHEYSDAVQQHNLHPILNPKITPVKANEGEDWVLKATSCEAPEIKLGKYKDAIKGLKAKGKIWTPDKAAKGTDKPQEVQLEQVFDELIKNVEIELPDMLVEDETSRLLANLVDQVNTAGLTMQQYLSTRGMTQEQLKEQYQQSAINTLKIELTLPKIAEEEKIEVTPKEVEELLNKSQDEKTKQAMENPQQRMYIMLMLRKQKTVDFLKGL